jgi:hypothetical protein
MDVQSYCRFRKISTSRVASLLYHLTDTIWYLFAQPFGLTLGHHPFTKAGSFAVGKGSRFRRLMRSIATFPHRVRGNCAVSFLTLWLIALTLSLKHGGSQLEGVGWSLRSKGLEQ